MTRTITEIFVHCSATRKEWMSDRPATDKREEIDRWHRQRGWKGFGYHYLIDRDGTVAEGRPVERIGAHVSGHNTGTIGVSLFGGHGAAATDRFSDHFTPAQDAALRRLLSELQARFPSATKISGHNEYAAKGCPGFQVRPWLAGAGAPAPKPAAADPDAVERARWRLAAMRDLAVQALAELPDPR